MNDINDNIESNELFEHFSITADKGQEPLRVDRFLMNFIENATRSKIQHAAKSGNVWVNGIQVKSNYKVKANDLVKVLMETPKFVNEILAEDIPLDVVFEDEDLMVINKPPGLVVHPGHGNYTGTLVNALKFHFDNLPNLDAELERPGIVHRIDKDTSGLLVVAKSEIAMKGLAKQFFDRSTKRRYLSIVWGNMKEDQGTIEGNIGRHVKNRLRMAVFPDGSEGKHAVTHYKVLERFRYVTLIECRLETGRTHQIRAHLKHIGHTLYNDERYAGDRILKGTTFSKYKQFVDNTFKLLPRQALHAASLGFKHPVTGQDMHFETEIPDDMKAVVEKWRVYTNSYGDQLIDVDEDIDESGKLT